MKRHGMMKHGGYKSWINMKDRCHSPRLVANYGARGITVCDRWRYDFPAFWEDMGATWFEGATLERVNVNGNYEPTNCTWATKSEQQKNKRGLVKIETPWGVMTLADASRKLGMSPMAFGRRYKLGWRGDKLFQPPVEKGARVTPRVHVKAA